MVAGGRLIFGAHYRTTYYEGSAKKAIRGGSIVPHERVAECSRGPGLFGVFRRAGKALCHRSQAIQFDTYIAMGGWDDASAVFLNRKTSNTERSAAMVL
jgi:hypothetical protein